MITCTEEKQNTIRRYSFKGLGNLARLLSQKTKQVNEESKEKEDIFLDIDRAVQIVKALFLGMEDHNEACAREALASM